MRSKDKMINGFSKLSKTEKLTWLAKNFLTSNPIEVVREFASFWHTNVEAQHLFDGLSENTVSNFYLPYGLAPNFLVNNKTYCVPMVIEESSVVAAASSGAKFWYERGGFKAKVLGVTKTGHVHFYWPGTDPVKMFSFFKDIKPKLLNDVKDLTENMEKRGGGLTNLSLLYKPEIEPGYYQLKADFETCDAMGANFINSVLERLALLLDEAVEMYPEFEIHEQEVQIIMAILSNYTPDCLVHAWVECAVSDLGNFDDLNAEEFAQKFVRALNIARNDVYRATTHNKGIYNGIDAVILATGNDFRAIEACGHAYAAKDGQYRSLSSAKIEDNKFTFEIKLPLAIGTIGGLTKIHPLARISLEMLGNPSATELMQVIASVGLAQNFAAVRSLITTGIQQGHMKMHLGNILTTLQVSFHEREQALIHFADKIVSYKAVWQFIDAIRQSPTHHDLMLG